MPLYHGFATGPANAVYAGGTLRPGIREAIAGGIVTPGALLVASATDGRVVEAGAGVGNIVGIAAENNRWDNASGTFFKDYAEGEPVPYYFEPGIMHYGMIAAGSAALVYGDLLETAAGGELVKRAAGVAVAQYEDPADFTPGGTMTRKLCKFRGGGV